MINGRKSLNSCAHVRTSTLDGMMIADASSRLCCGWHEAVLPGDCCLSATGTGTASTNALPAGVIRAYGNECISILCKTLIWSTSSLIALWSVPTPAPQEPRKNGGQVSQALGRSRGGFSTKIHISVDALGNPLRGFAPKVNLRLMVRQAHHERKYENPFALSLSKGDLAKQGTFGAKLLCALS